MSLTNTFSITIGLLILFLTPFIFQVAATRTLFRKMDIPMNPTHVQTCMLTNLPLFVGLILFMLLNGYSLFGEMFSLLMLCATFILSWILGVQIASHTYKKDTNITNKQALTIARVTQTLAHS